MRAAIILLTLSLTGCQTDKVDAFISNASEKLHTACPFLQAIAATAADNISPNRQAVYQKAIAAFNVACSAPVTDVVSAAILAYDAYKAAKAAGLKPTVALVKQ